MMAIINGGYKRMHAFFKDGPILASYSLFFIFIFSVAQLVDKIFPMSGFKPLISGVRSNALPTEPQPLPNQWMHVSETKKWKVFLCFPFWRFRGEKKKTDGNCFGNFALPRIISTFFFSLSASNYCIFKLIITKKMGNRSLKQKNQCLYNF